MAHETEVKILKLVQKLHEKSQAGELKWERTGSERAFQVPFSSYVVRVWARPGEGDSDYYLAIKDETGTTLEEANDVQIEKALPNSRAFVQMRDLYNFARRQALGVDQALDSILNELG